MTDEQEGKFQLTGLPTDHRIDFNIGPDCVELLSMRANGDFYIRGKLAVNDLEIVNAFREFLQSTGHLK